jgi:protein SCO1/2
MAHRFIFPASARRLALLALAPAAALLAGCDEGASARAAAAAAPPSEWRGTLLVQPAPKPEFTLTDTEGRPYDFRARTDGHVTLLFFGYTHCPDVCPIHLASIARVLDDLPYEDRQRVRVVFVSTDPDRDTPERIRSWLDAFDPSFVGLRGTVEEVNAIQARMGLPEAVKIDPGTPGAGIATDGGYTVGHAAQVVAYGLDDRAHLIYPFGTRQRDWAADLPKLVSERWTSR